LELLVVKFSGQIAVDVACRVCALASGSGVSLAAIKLLSKPRRAKQMVGRGDYTSIPISEILLMTSRRLRAE
jgi:hypothetical protein